MPRYRWEIYILFMVMNAHSVQAKRSELDCAEEEGGGREGQNLRLLRELAKLFKRIQIV